MPIIRRKLEESDVYPATIRYDEETDTVQSLVNGSWVDNPDADPRHQITYPPRLTSNPRCDAAQSVTDAMKNQVDQTIEAVGNSVTVFQIAALILGLFSFGLFAIFINLALALGRAMLSAGEGALNAALTPTVWHQFTCILLCALGENGRMTPEGLEQAKTDVDEQIGGLAALVLNSMLQIAGEGGVSNLASLGTSTGDCSDCDSCVDLCSAANQPDYFTWGEVISVTGSVVRVKSVLYTPSPTFMLVSWGDYGVVGDRCCFIVNIEVVSGSWTGSQTEFTECDGTIVANRTPVGETPTHFSLYTATTETVFDITFAS